MATPKIAEQKVYVKLSSVLMLQAEIKRLESSTTLSRLIASEQYIRGLKYAAQILELPI